LTTIRFKWSKIGGPKTELGDSSYFNLKYLSEI